MKTGNMIALGAVSLSAVGIISYLVGFQRGYTEACNEPTPNIDDTEFNEDVESYYGKGEE